MGTPEQFDLFDEESGDDAEQEENNLENSEEGEMSDRKEIHENEADKIFREKIEGAEATTIEKLKEEIGYPKRKPAGAPKEIGPGRKAALELLEKFRNQKK